MCAASVYPEPGSNSLVYGIYIFINTYQFKFELKLIFFKIFVVVLDFSFLPLGFSKGYFIVYFSMYFAVYFSDSLFSIALLNSKVNRFLELF